MKKIPFFQIASLFILFSAGAWATQAYIPELKKQLKDTYSSLTKTLKPSKNSEEPEPIEVALPAPRVIPPIPEGIITKEYDKHLFAGESNGFGAIEDKGHFESLIEQEKLIQISQGT
ncbi:MAG: hypothetical protein ABJC55_06755, partial [Algoriphagus sp.]